MSVCIISCQARILVGDRGGARNFCLEGPICVANLLVYTNFHTHTQTYASIHIHKKLVSFFFFFDLIFHRIKLIFHHLP